MLIADVKRLSPPERFLYWIQERYAIALRRAAGEPKPWTDDAILQQYFFTHPYREMDKVTVWFRENVREPLRDDPRVVFATVAFRWFNLPTTGDILLRCSKFGDKGHYIKRGAWPTRPTIDDFRDNLLVNWYAPTVLNALSRARSRGNQIFTGAYLINSPGGEPKLEAIVRRINNVWEARGELEAAWDPRVTMEGVHAGLTAFDGMGGFMAYEVVCDLRWTYFLENAPDKLTWCHVGPGARRGLYRVLGIDFPKGNNASGCPRLLKPVEETAEMQKLLAMMRRKLRGMPPFEMREVEMSLCEVDKYERALWGDGRLKRRYDGVGG
jgi:hypothetical protein